jgi:hypothetical protein
MYGAMHIDLSDDETAALLRELDKIIEGDRFPLSLRVLTLKAIRAKLRPEPNRHRRADIEGAGELGAPEFCCVRNRKYSLFAGRNQVSKGFDLLFDADDEILVSREVMEWITEMETLQAAGLSADEIAETLKDRFPVSGAGVERLLQLHRDGLVKVAGEGA